MTTWEIKITPEQARVLSRAVKKRLRNLSEMWQESTLGSTMVLPLWVVRERDELEKLADIIDASTQEFFG